MSARAHPDMRGDRRTRSESRDPDLYSDPTIGEGTSGRMIVAGTEAYVSPSWYASKAEHGKVVPTWNYLAVHLTGTLHVHHDPAWLLGAVTDLTLEHESGRPAPWHVSDAPDDYIASLLKAIVGVEMVVERVEGKAKLSQNRSEPDRAGVIEGVRREPDRRSGTSMAEAMLALDDS